MGSYCLMNCRYSRCDEQNHERIFGGDSDDELEGRKLEYGKNLKDLNNNMNIINTTNQNFLRTGLQSESLADQDKQTIQESNHTYKQSNIIMEKQTSFEKLILSDATTTNDKLRHLISNIEQKKIDFVLLE